MFASVGVALVTFTADVEFTVVRDEMLMLLLLLLLLLLMLLIL